MKAKKIFIPIAILVLCITAGICLFLFLWPGYKMPVMPFAYQNANYQLYVFASDGNIYLIDNHDVGSNPLGRLYEAIDVLENGQTAEWLKPYGKTSVFTLKNQYRDFRRITDDPAYDVFPTEEAVPTVIPVEPYITPDETWYGFTEDNACRTFFLKGYLAYKATNNRIENVAFWLSKEAGTGS